MVVVVVPGGRTGNLGHPSRGIAYRGIPGSTEKGQSIRASSGTHRS